MRAFICCTRESNRYGEEFRDVHHVFNDFFPSSPISDGRCKGFDLLCDLSVVIACLDFSSLQWRTIEKPSVTMYPMDQGHRSFPSNHKTLLLGCHWHWRAMRSSTKTFDAQSQSIMEMGSMHFMTSIADLISHRNTPITLIFYPAGGRTAQHSV